MVPPLVEESHSHQDPQRGPKFGQDPYDDIHINGGVGVSQSGSANDSSGPLVGYQHLPYEALPPQPYPLHGPPQSISSQAILPQACPQQCLLGPPAQGYNFHGYPQGNAQTLHPSWSSPPGYPARPAPNHYNCSTATPLGQGHARHFPDTDPTLPPTPKQKPSETFGSVHSHPHRIPGQQVLRQEYQSAPPHTNSNQLFRKGVLHDNHAPGQGDGVIANSHSLQQTFPDLNLNAPIDDSLNPQFIEGQQQRQHGEYLHCPSTSDSPS